MQVLSHAHVECIINDHRFVGWAEDDPPYEFETEDAAEFRMGQDGGLYGLSRPMFGCIFRFRLTPTSPTTQWAMDQEQIRKNDMKASAALRIYQGSFSDPAQGVSWTLSGGGILNFPPVRIANQTYEGAISTLR